VLAAILAPYIAPHDPYRGSMLRRLRPIGTDGYPLGTDELGRDMLSRLIVRRAAVAVHGHRAGASTPS
jgi:peptide/nickel transport system permease protein